MLNISPNVFLLGNLNFCSVSWSFRQWETDTDSSKRACIHFLAVYLRSGHPVHDHGCYGRVKRSWNFSEITVWRRPRKESWLDDLIKTLVSIHDLENCLIYWLQISFNIISHKLSSKSCRSCSSLTVRTPSIDVILLWKYFELYSRIFSLQHLSQDTYFSIVTLYSLHLILQFGQVFPFFLSLHVRECPSLFFYSSSPNLEDLQFVLCMLFFLLVSLLP